MGYDLTNIFVFFLFAVVFVIVTVSVLSALLRPRNHPADEPAKEETYECGEPAVGSSWVRFDIRFYTVALIFLIFDVEVAFLYPWGVVFEPLRVAGLGLFVFMEMLLFLAILVVGFVYCWKRGDLDWIKSSEGQPRLARRPAAGARRRQPTSGAPQTLRSAPVTAQPPEADGKASPAGQALDPAMRS
jgi:NADH-quinone oxidoreductase subunit A